ncbi:MAG: SurA N-terminal domain-containing protein [Pseudomonadota bacterium]
MFDFVHEKKRLVQIVLAVIVLPFAFWGVDSYRRSSGGEAVAKVGGDKISPQEFENAMRQQQERMRELMGANFDPAMLDAPEIKQSVLENLISQRLLQQRAHDARLAISDEQLAQLIASIGAFQKDGKFDKQRYEAALAEQGMSSAMFESRVRQDLAARQLTDAYLQNGFASRSVADGLIRANEQQRVVSLSFVSPAIYLPQVKVDDAAVKSYYDKNPKEFEAPERVRVEYVVFSADGMQGQVAVDDAEVKKYYEEHHAEFETQEQRQAAHILIAAGKQASEAERQAAKAKAEQVLQQVKLNPAKFGELAKQYSQDPGSAVSGGDLGVFGRGMMVKPFEDAVYSLKPGEVSGIVQTDFGYHIIKLSAVKGGKVLSFDEVKKEISAKLKQQKAADKFAELADKFGNAVYEQSDSLKPAADLVKAGILQSGWLVKGAVAGPPWNDKAIQAVFSDDVLKNKRNTSAIEIAPNVLLAARLIEHKPASLLPLAEVSGGVRQKLQLQQAQELAVKEGKSLLEKVQKGEKVAVDWKGPQTLTRAQRAGLDNALIKLIFSANSAKMPGFVGAENPQGGYLLARVEAVRGIDGIDDAKRARYMQQLRQMSGEALLQAYLADARKQAEVSIEPSFMGEKK